MTENSCRVYSFYDVVHFQWLHHTKHTRDSILLLNFTALYYGIVETNKIQPYLLISENHYVSLSRNSF